MKSTCYKIPENDKLTFVKSTLEFTKDIYEVISARPLKGPEGRGLGQFHRREAQT